MATGRVKKDPLRLEEPLEGPAEFVPVCSRPREGPPRWGEPVRRRLPRAVRVAAIFRR